MEILVDYIDHKLNLERYTDKTSAFFDIETTGFSRQKNMVYLIGLILYDKDKKLWELRQYFISDPNRERELITRFISDLEDIDQLISFNGDTFDIPFINNRSEHLGLESRIKNIDSFDLYKLARKNKDILNLRDLKLKTIEESLGYFREDKYTGYECIQFYKDYVVSSDLESREKLLKHNYDDLMHMLDIIEIIDLIKEKKSIELDNGNIFYLEDFNFYSNKLVIKGRLKNKLDIDINSYQTDYNISSSNKKNIYLEVYCSEGYIDEYSRGLYYLLKEDQLIGLRPITFSRIPRNILILKKENNLIFKNIKILTYIILNINLEILN